MTAPIDERLATWSAEEPRLLGGRCDDCGTTTFPQLDGCPRCGSESIQQTELSRRGTLWTWTTQDFPVKRPYVGRSTAEEFEPYLLGYVELPDGLKVESRLVGCEAESVRIGMAMELTVVPFATDDERGEVLTFAFRPAGEDVGT